MNSLFHATFLWLSVVVVSFKNSLIFTQDVTDAGVNTCGNLKLVFLEKGLYFSGRQYFEIRWGFYVSNWKFPDCVHFFGAWAGQAVIETIAVVYELTKITQEKLFADWAQ